MVDRLHGRVPARMRVQFRSASSLLVAYSLNLSRGGMFLETDAPPEVGSELELALESGGQAETVTVRGRVTWRRLVADTDGPPGVGVEFEDMTDTLGTRIDQLVAEFSGLSVLLYCTDARERETLRRMLRTIVATAEIVGAQSVSLCNELCDDSVDLLVVEADEDAAGALEVVAAARKLASPVPVVALTGDDALAERLRQAGAGERVGNPPSMADLSRAVVRALGKPASISGA